jgi:hypothetical protein
MDREAVTDKVREILADRIGVRCEGGGVSAQIGPDRVLVEAEALPGGGQRRLTYTVDQVVDLVVDRLVNANPRSLNAARLKGVIPSTHLGLHRALLSVRKGRPHDDLPEGLKVLSGDQ